MDYQKLLLEHLELIDGTSRHVARRNHLSHSESDEFISLVQFRLIDRDFAILRKFQGRSHIGTYLMTVIERLYLDFSVARWGKWKPSAAARRLGRLAMRLEEFVVREGLTFDEAVGTLQTNHGVTATREELHAILSGLPPRSVRRFAGEDELAAVAAHCGAMDRALDRRDDLEVAERVEAALAVALATLTPHQQLILKLRYQDGLSVAKISRLWHADTRPIYQQLEETIAVLRKKLRQKGIDRTDIDRVVGHPAITLGRLFEQDPDPSAVPSSVPTSPGGPQAQDVPAQSGREKISEKPITGPSK